MSLFIYTKLVRAYHLPPLDIIEPKKITRFMIYKIIYLNKLKGKNKHDTI